MKTPEIIELIKVLLGSGGVLITFKVFYEKYLNHKRETRRKQDLQQTITSFKNIEKIFENIIHIGQEYNCNYVHIASIHNGGKAMNELSEKKITLKAEYRKDSIIPKIKHEWKNRDIDFDWFPLLNKVLDNESLHIEDVTEALDNNVGLNLMYNTVRGREFFIGKIDWVGDSLVVLILQRDPQGRKLTTKEIAFLTYKSKEFSKLFSSAKYFLEGKNQY